MYARFSGLLSCMLYDRRRARVWLDSGQIKTIGKRTECNTSAIDRFRTFWNSVYRTGGIWDEKSIFVYAVTIRNVFFFFRPGARTRRTQIPASHWTSSLPANQCYELKYYAWRKWTVCRVCKLTNSVVLQAMRDVRKSRNRSPFFNRENSFGIIYFFQIVERTLNNLPTA